MTGVTIRPATLDDVAAITEVHCSNVEVWRDPQTRRAVDCAELDLYGRWRNGGAWMSVESCAVHLNALLLLGHLPLVAEVEGRVVAEAEFYVDREPAPFAALHLSILYVHRVWQGQGIGRRLVEAGVQAAGERGLPTLTTQPEEEALAFYTRLGFSPWRSAQELQLRSRASAPVPRAGLQGGQVAPPPALALRIGRYQCGAQGWAALHPSLYLPGWSDLRRWLWEVELEGQRGLLGLREQLTDPAQADGYAWLPPEMSLEPAVAALQALGAAQGFAAVDLLLPLEALPALKRRFAMEYQAHIEIWQRAVGAP